MPSNLAYVRDEVPDHPARHEVPDHPARHEVPDHPAQHEVPDLPARHEVPDHPARHEVLDHPARHEVPDHPAQHEVPDHPAQHEVPDHPARHEVPDHPARHEVPDHPARHEVPDHPARHEENGLENGVVVSMERILPGEVTGATSQAAGPTSTQPGEVTGGTSQAAGPTSTQPGAVTGGTSQAAGPTSTQPGVPITIYPEVHSPTQPVSTNDLLYKVDDTPAWYIGIFLGFQHYLTMVGATITIPFILTPLMCIEDNDPVRGKIVSSIIFVSGLVTLLQATFGVRLPIVQGGTFSFLVPTIAILTTTFDACDSLPLGNMTAEGREEVWQERMREVQGAIAVSAIFQVIVGFTGVMGVLLTWITPLTVVPTVTLVGLSLFHMAAKKAALHWGISFMTMALMMVFSQYLGNVTIPVPTYTNKSGFRLAKHHIFKLFPVLLAMCLSWGLCAVLTAGGVFPEGSKARTDLTTDLLNGSPWFRIPYPCQWGRPTVSVSGVFGMLAGVLASMIESVGDYYACARISGAPPPPTHAINRGIGIEGIGCVLAGLWGTGNGTTSYSENIGAIGVTKVGSRRVVQYGALIMLVVGMLGKFGALFVTIPEPVIGGVFCVMFSMITAVGISSLQYIDLNSSRNLFVLGFSIFFGLALPKWMEENPGVIQTGSIIVDQILTVLLQTSMFVGGLLGLFLDNTIPGSAEERGLLKWNAHHLHPTKDDPAKTSALSTCYDLPLGMDAIRRWSWAKYIPVSPTYTGLARKRV